jgi:hypothetical protein
MSEEQNNSDAPVTMGQLSQILQDMSKTYTDAITNLSANFEETISKKINAQDARMSQAIDQQNIAINQIVEHINKGGQTAQQQGRGQITDILNSPAGQELIPIIKEKLGLSTGQPDPEVEEFRRNTEQLNRIVYKKAALMTARMIEKGMKGMLSSEFTTTSAKDLATSAISHEPI